MQPPLLEYAYIFRQSTCLTPVVFVLSPGADPAYDLFKLGEELGFKPGSKLKYMALGQGMGPRAQEAVEVGATRGLWIMLQNCHLLPKWLKTLEKILEKVHAFCCWEIWSHSYRCAYCLRICCSSIQAAADNRSSQGLPPMADYRSDRRISVGNLATVIKNCYRATQRSETQHALLLFQDLGRNSAVVSAQSLSTAGLRFGVFSCKCSGTKKVWEAGLECSL